MTHPERESAATDPDEITSLRLIDGAMFYVGVLLFRAHSDFDPAHRVSYAAYGVPFVIAGCLLVVASMARATRHWLKRRSP